MPAAPRTSISPLGELDDSNVLRFLALPAGSDVELDALTLVEALVALTDDVGEVDEHIVALLTRDEAEALLCVEELHGTCSQELLFSFKCDGLCDRTH